MVERPIQLVHRLGSESVADVWSVKRDPDGSEVVGSVIGDV